MKSIESVFPCFLTRKATSTSSRPFKLQHAIFLCKHRYLFQLSSIIGYQCITCHDFSAISAGNLCTSYRKSKRKELEGAEQPPVSQTNRCLSIAVLLSLRKGKFWAKYQTMMSRGKRIKENQFNIKVYPINDKDVRAELKAAEKNQ